MPRTKLKVVEQPGAQLPAGEEIRNTSRISKAWISERAAQVVACLNEIRDLQWNRAAVQLRLSAVLCEVKSQIKHGRWAAFCKECGMSQRTVEMYIRVGSHSVAQEIFVAVGLAKGEVLAGLTEEQLRPLLDDKESLEEKSIGELRDQVRNLQGKPAKTDPAPRATATRPRTLSEDLAHQGRMIDTFRTTESLCALARLQFDTSAIPTLSEIRERHAVVRAAFANQPSFLPALDEAKAILDAAVGRSEGPVATPVAA